MNYFLVRKKCYMLENKLCLLPNVWYQVDKEKTVILVFDAGIKIADLNQNPTICHAGNRYYIFDCPNNESTVCHTIRFENKNISISVSNRMHIIMEGNVLLNMPIENCEFVQSQEFCGHLILYFAGVRNFFVVIKDGKVVAKDYYTKLNVDENQIYFLNPLFDFLNHGRVYNLSKQGMESYLVYLDDYDLNLKEEFVPFVMLDLIKAKNFNYANQLLADDLKQAQTRNIEKFFEPFDSYLPICNNRFCLLKNDACVGIVKFEVLNKVITNIIIE